MDRNNKPSMVENNEIEINLFDILLLLKDNFGKILGLALVGAIVALAATMFLIKPTYRSYFTAFINNKSANAQSAEGTDKLNGADLSTSQDLTYTYTTILKSAPLIDKALERAGLSDVYSAGAVLGNTTTSIDSNTQIINLYVTLPSSEDAYRISKALVEVSPDYIADIVEGSSMKIITSPVLATNQYTPDTRKNTAIGFFVGAVIMCLLVMVNHFRDTRIRNEQELENKFGLQIIGLIPNAQSGATNGYYYYRGSRYYHKGDGDHKDEN